MRLKLTRFVRACSRMEQDIISDTDGSKKVMLEKWSDSQCFFILLLEKGGQWEKLKVIKGEHMERCTKPNSLHEAGDTSGFWY